MKRVLIVIQPSVSHYRAPLLGKLIEDNRFDFVFLGKYTAGPARNTKDSVKQADADLLALVRPITEIGLVGNLKWQKGVLAETLKTSADIYVFEGNPYNLSTWVALLVCRVRRKTTALWGHGWKRPDRNFRLFLRKSFYRLGGNHLVYGDWAKLYAGAVGLLIERFFPVYNSIYPDSVIAEYSESIDKSRRSSIGRPEIALLYCGRLTARHQVEIAIEAVSRLLEQGTDVSLTIIGEGSERARLMAEASLCGSSIKFVGAEYDLERLVSYYDEADFAVSPGASGLNVIQALGFGTPVLAARSHRDSGPEIEAVIDGETGFCFEANSVDGLMKAILKAGGLSSDEKRRMESESVALVRSRFTTDSHARAIQDALDRM